METTLERPLAQMTIGDLLTLIEQVVEAKLAPLQKPESLARHLELRAALARECTRLSPEEEQTWAEIGMNAEAELWPAY